MKGPPQKFKTEASSLITLIDQVADCQETIAAIAELVRNCSGANGATVGTFNHAGGMILSEANKLDKLLRKMGKQIEKA